MNVFPINRRASWISWAVSSTMSSSSSAAWNVSNRCRWGLTGSRTKEVVLKSGSRAKNKVYVLIGHYVQTCSIVSGHQANLVGHYIML